MKKPTILATLIAPCLLCYPRPAYGDETIPEGTAAGALSAAPVAPDIGTVSGDEQPDWSAIDDKHADDPKGPETLEGAGVKKGIEPAPGEQPPEKVEKPPEKVEKPPEKPAAPADEAAAAAAKAAEEAAKVKPPEFDADAAAKKLDEIQIKETASKQTKEGFAALKEVTRTAVGRVKELQGKLTEAEQRAAKVPPEIEAELKELRGFRETWGAEHDTGFTKPFDDRVAKAETSLLETLVKDPELTLPQAEADELKAAGFDTPAGKAKINDLLRRLQAHGDPLLYERVKDMFLARNGILREKADKLAQVREKQGGYYAEQEARGKAEMQDWGGKADAKLIDLFKADEWARKKAAPADATPEAKALADQHNEWLEKTLVPGIREHIAAVYNRDPEKAMETVYKATAYDQAAKELAGAKADLAKAQARITELEQTARGVRQVSAISKADNAPVVPAKGEIDPNETAEQAVDRHVAEIAAKRGGIV